MLTGALALLTAFWLVGGRAAAAEAVYPVERSCGWFSRNVASRARALWRRQSLGAENARLRRQVEALRMALAEAGRDVKTESDAERALSAAGWIRAEILGRNGATGVTHLMRIGAGSLDGVRKGAAVVAPDGLVGKIVETSPHTASVRLVTDPSMKVACEIETGAKDRGAAYGILSGGGSKTVAGDETCGIVYSVCPMRIEHVDPERPGTPAVPPRARVVTSGLGGIYPRGIAVGYLVERLVEDETKLEREGDVIPAVDFQSLENVFVRRER